MRLVKKNIRLGTWNVRTLCQPGKLRNAIVEMHKMRLDILGMSEVRWPGNGKCTTKGGVLYYSGVQDQECRIHGVGVLIKDEINKFVENFVPYSERCMLLQLRAQPFNINIIQVYAPTADNTDEERERFYDQIDNICKRTKRYDINIVMGDLNAKVGEQAFEGITGKFGLGQRNEAGERLLEFCQENNLVIANTWFQHPARRLYTWRSPQDDHNNIVRNQIDYIMINSRFRNAITSAKTYPGADIESDHVPVVAQIKVRLKKKLQPKITQRLDMEELKNPYIKLQLTENINAKIKSLPISDDIENQWINLKRTIKHNASDTLGKKTCRKNKDWMTQEILDHIEERRRNKYNPREYNRLKNLIKKETRTAKDNWLNAKCQEIENLERQHDSFNLHKKIKEFTHTGRRRTYGKLVDENNKLIIDAKDHQDLWVKYIKTLFHDSRGARGTLTADEHEGPEILKSEMMHAIKLTKDGKAPGPDGINVELLKLLDEDSQTIMLKLFNQIYQTGRIPEDWLTSEFITLPKTASSKKCSDYRLISLMSHTLKVFLRIIHTRIWRKIDANISETQFGFRNGVGTREALFAIQVLVQKCLDRQTTVNACFIDYEKAFDNVKHEKLIEILQSAGIDSKDINIIRNLYWNQKAYVGSKTLSQENVEILKGVRQGCVLSPLLFNLYSEAIFQEALEEVDRGIKINGHIINNIRFADDTVIIANTMEDLQILVNRVNDISTQYGLKINLKKTKYMTVSKAPTNNTVLLLDNQHIERVSRFKYLGCWLNDTWDPDVQVRSRIEIARSTFFKLRPLLSNKDLKLATRWRVTQCYVLSTLLYGVEGWTLKLTTMRRLEAFEMWLFRRILKISWVDRVTNTEVLQRMNKQQELLTTVKKRKAAYFGHILRHQRYSILQLIMEGNIEGKRGLGRKRCSWLRNLRDWFQIRDAARLIRLAQNKEEYQMMIANLR